MKCPVQPGIVQGPQVAEGKSIQSLALRNLKSSKKIRYFQRQTACAMMKRNRILTEEVESSSNLKD